MRHTFSSLAAAAAGLAAPAVLATSALASPAHHYPSRSTAHHRGEARRQRPAAHRLSALDHRYLDLYHQAQAKLGDRAPGRDIVLDGLTPTKPATVFSVEKSINTLVRMLVVTEPAPATVSTEPTTTTTTTTTTATSAAPAPEAAASGMTACIIARESGGNPEAVNGSGYMGEGQWDESTWLADGGGAYGATPLDASAAEQQQVIANQVAAGNTGQWTNYDGC